MTILEENNSNSPTRSEAASSPAAAVELKATSASVSSASSASGAAKIAAVEASTSNYLSGMISNAADRYITPEYLAPLPSSNEKSGKSPLQLLAQTCSQIGADPGNAKAESKTKESKSKGGSSPALIVSDSTSPTHVRERPVSFKPYETSSERKKANKTPSSVVSLSPNGNNNNRHSPSKAAASSKSSSTTTTTSSSETTPVIRSGMEVLAGHPKDLPLGFYANPAFRPSLAGCYPPSFMPPTSLAASLAAAAAGSLGSSVCRDPYCRDPTCPTAIYNAQLAASLMASGLPPGYAELLQAHKASATPSTGPAPYICNWNGREGYCGKRHNSAEELLQHLRTHTNLSTSDSAIYSASAAAFQRSYGSALSSLGSSSRFHPYAAAAAAAAAKSSALPPSLGMPPPGTSGLGSMPPGLASSLYSSSLYASLYGARLAGSLP